MRGRPGFLSYQTRVSFIVYLHVCVMCQLASLCNHVGKSIKTSLYWAMKNCGGDAECLRQLITNISKHYQVYIATCYCTRGSITLVKLFKGIHVQCHSSSHCHRADYRPRKQILTDPLAIEALENTLRRVNIYRYAESYCRVSIHAESVVPSLFVVNYPSQVSRYFLG